MKDIMAFLLSGGIVTGVAIFLIKTYVKNLFNRNIESYKVELTKSLKDVEFDYQRKFEDFSLYTQKRHQIYAEIYRLIQQASSELSEVILKKTVLSKSMSMENLYKVLLEEKFGEKEIDDIIEKWNRDPFKTIETVTKIIDHKKLEKANIAVEQALTFFKENELYISDEIAIFTQEILHAIKDIYGTQMAYLQIPNSELDRTKWKNYFENENFIKDKLITLKKQMKEELSIGYYKQ
ncbi:hypothetical protein C2H96_08425 [Bacillus subtilis]|uniref:hypothetical protein n=1 Tax=Bacillus subtilis group TaxID=653685 RepID=UPI0009B7D6C6|nr:MULTISPECIES: hypothetical protein [Bacillus subtilis group]ARC70979.1 hypothetical protein B34_03614 [Bacillus licheniformis]MCA0105788.1 hypothetical protein [Bacillus subtilis]QAV99088.1 hypothetical protein ES969_02860 [Bacillus subtilis]RJS51508.1 hypothetical protein CJ480_06705 [Bacillus subtilis]UQZ54539.1 hypothetical protein C2H96_08425 [Bacillus subtilis]